MSEEKHVGCCLQKYSVVWIIAGALLIGALGFAGGMTFQKARLFRNRPMMQQFENYRQNGRQDGRGEGLRQRRMDATPAAELN